MPSTHSAHGFGLCNKLLQIGQGVRAQYWRVGRWMSNSVCPPDRPFAVDGLQQTIPSTRQDFRNTYATTDPSGRRRPLCRNPFEPGDDAVCVGGKLFCLATREGVEPVHVQTVHTD